MTRRGAAATISPELPEFTWHPDRGLIDWDRPPPGYSHADAVRELAIVYAALPAIACKGRCADSCTLVTGSPLELAEVARRGRPLMAPGEWTSNRSIRALLPIVGRPRCPNLGPLRTCTVYAVRPMICRLFGLIGKLRPDDEPDQGAALACDHGCQPERWLTEGEGFVLLAAVEVISRRWEAAGRPGPEAAS